MMGLPLKDKKPIMNKQVPPFTLKFELTEGCNLHCKFCGISGIRKKPGSFRFMTVDTASHIIGQLKDLKSRGWHPKLDCAMHGEPLMNPDAHKIFNLFREAFPDIYMYVTSNGGPLFRGKGIDYNIDRLLESLNIIALDDYKYANIVPKILERYSGKYKDKIFTYPEIQIYCKQKASLRSLLVFPDISGNKKVKARRFNNQAGASGPADYSMLKHRCAKPFRELAIKHDGEVVLCCNDWRRYFRVGSLLKNDMESLWNHQAMVSVRRTLFHSGRIFSICLGCNSLAYRTGLLPDLSAKYTVKIPNEKDQKNIQKIVKKGSDIQVYVKKFREVNSGIRSFL